MIILVDTCFWSHAKELNDESIIDIREHLAKYRWGYTPAVKQEIHYRKLDDYSHADKAILFPVSKEERLALHAKVPTTASLDVADQELLVAIQRESGMIMSDDGEFLMECDAQGISAISLPVFLLLLVRGDVLEKRTVSRCLRFWETSHRFKLKQISRWKKELQEIQ